MRPPFLSLTSYSTKGLSKKYVHGTHTKEENVVLSSLHRSHKSQPRPKSLSIKEYKDIFMNLSEADHLCS